MDSKKKKQCIVDGDHRLEIQGFRISYMKATCVWLGILMSCGILWAALNWRKRYYMYYSHSPCTLRRAQKVLLIDNYNQDFVVKINYPLDIISKQSRYFYFKKMKYAWNDKESTFTVVGGLNAEKCSFFHQFKKGMSSTEADRCLSFYGKNTIHIQVKPVIRLILREVVSPFYIYQVFIVTVWFLQYYYQFGVCIIVLSVISVAATVWETRKQSRSLREAMRSETTVTVYRDSKETKVHSEELVPGDVIILPYSCKTISCDCVLEIFDFSTVGESIPITKVPVSEDDDSSFDVSSNKRSILSCGTELLISRCSGDSSVKAVVYRTGFSTAKGELVRAILYPKPVKIKLHTDLLKCMVIFFVLGIPALIYTGIVTTRLEAHPWDIALFLLNVVTFFVPPALPAVLTSINEQAQRRLRKEGIFCLNTRYINVAGGLDIVCFDKTGTLTEDSLDISDIVPAINGKFGEVLNRLGISAPQLEKAFACCHSLSNINDKLTGYDLDIKMFKSIDWVLKEPTINDAVPFKFLPARIVFPKIQRYLFQEHGYVALVRQFPFESIFKRMSVVTKSERSHSFEVFLKGAPEIVASICQKDTVPDDMKVILDSYSSKGFRVIAFASKTLNQDVTITHIEKMKREDFEKNMTFLGLLVLENKLKDGTVSALQLLRDADIRLIMVTGDNLLTAVTVSRNCGIVEENNSVILVEAKTTPDIYSNLNDKLDVSFTYANQINCVNDSSVSSKNDNVNLPIELGETYSIAMEGETFNLLRVHDAHLLIKLVLRGAVFARMSPEHKLHLIEILQNLGYQVGMCGDGANDCGALKTAHTGVSLSMAEASVAAPFTATQQDIRCISTLIREGRATLVSTFDAFRYMVCYTFMFLVAILMLLWDGQRPSDGAYVIIDVILNLSPPFLFGATGAYYKLVKNHPTRSVLSFIPLFSIISFMFFQICTMSIAYEFCLSQPWYVPFSFDKKNAHFPESSYSGTTILMVNMMTYLTAAIAFPTGKPYRARFSSNKLYVSAIIAQFILVGLIFLYPPGFLISYLNFKLAPTLRYHLNLLAISLGGMTFCFIWEKFIVQRFLANFILPKLKGRRGPKRKYEKLAQSLSDEEWHPMLSKEDYSNNDEQPNTVCSVSLSTQITKRENYVNLK
nr:polyamine-transporting ATPase 13A3 [Parasteatoda tepidariorum]